MVIPCTYFGKCIQIVDEYVLLTTCINSKKTNLFKLLMLLVLTSCGKYANIFSHFEVS